MKFTEILKELRENRDQNMSQAARELKVKYTTYVGWASGKREPDLESLTRIANHYGVTLDYLVSGGAEDGGGAYYTQIEQPRDSFDSEAAPFVRRTAGMVCVPLLGGGPEEVFISPQMASQGRHFAIRVTDGEMERAGIGKGDVLIVRETDLPESGTVAVLEEDGRYIALRCHRFEAGTLYAPEAGNRGRECIYVPNKGISPGHRFMGRAVECRRSL